MAFVGPEGQRERGEVVDQGDGVAVGGEVDGAQVGAAGVAGFDADVGKLLGDVDGELGFGLFAAIGAEDAAKFPFLGAEGAEQETLAAVALAAKDAEQGSATAERAERGGDEQGGHGDLFGEEFGVRLEEGAGDELGERVGGGGCGRVGSRRDGRYCGRQVWRFGGGRNRRRR